MRVIPRVEVMAEAFVSSRESQLGPGLQIVRIGFERWREWEQCWGRQLGEKNYRKRRAQTWKLQRSWGGEEWMPIRRQREVGLWTWSGTLALRHYRTGIVGVIPAIERVLILLLDSQDLGIISCWILMTNCSIPSAKSSRSKTRHTMSIPD